MGKVTQNTIVSEISELYELSLAMGNSLNTSTICEEFLEVLSRQKNLEYCSVWVKDNIKEHNANTYKQVYAEPQNWSNQTLITSDHSIIQTLKSNNNFECRKVLKKDDPNCLFLPMSTGKTWNVCLPGIGFMQLFLSENNPYFDLFDTFELKKIRKVIERFANSLRACLTHEALEVESQKSLKMQVELQKLAIVSEKTENLVIITDKNGKIEWVNRGFENSSGYYLDEVKGKKPGSFLQGPDTDQEAIAYFSNHLKKQVSFRKEILNYHKDGTAYWVDALVQPIFDENQNLVSFIAVETDISNTKKNEKELKKAKEVAEEAIKVKDDLMSIIGHEVKAPISALIAMAELMHQMDLTIAQSDYVNAIQVSADNLRSIINSMLDYSEIESGQLELKKVPFNLEQIFQNIITRLELKAEEKSLGLFLNFDPNIYSNFIGDPVRLSQVVISLTNSAIKYAQEGPIVISANLITKMANANVVEISVKDGNKVHLNENWEVLSNHETPSQFKSNDSMGLSIAKELVKQMGGDLKVTHHKDDGTTCSFVIGLPLGSEDEGKEVIKSSKLFGKRVLLAEDNMLNQFFAKKMMESWKIEVDAVGNGKQAIQKAKNKAYDLILMDLQMPELDGKKATKEIRAQNLKVPIIALTGVSNKEELKNLSIIGFNDYLAKPFLPEDLQNILNNNISKASTLNYGKSSSSEKLYNNSFLIKMMKSDLVQVRHMERLFAKQSLEIEEQMLKNLKEHNIKQLGELAQKIKASIDLMQIKNLKDEIRSLELSCRKKEPIESIEKMVHKIVASLKQVREQISQSHQ